VYTRREALSAIAACSLSTARAVALPGVFRNPDVAPPAIDGVRLRSRLETLSLHGRPPGGTFESGVSRVAYSDADLAGRAYVIGLIRGAGLQPRIDPAGNIFARREGHDRSAPPILFGSHIDSVPQGGNFDGDLGSLAAIEVIERLRERGHVTRHPLEIVVWAHEESTAFARGLAGSRIVAGDIRPADLTQTWNGMTREEAIRRIGGVPERIADAAREKGSFHCYVELHIEQGATLHRQSVPVGIVQGIVAIDGFDVTITGFANHAGTTPMDQRQDALIAASQLTLAVREVVTARPGRHVGTVGHLEVAPNSPNVIPGQVRLSIELRDLSPDTLTALAEAIATRADQIARDTRTTIALKPDRHNPPASADMRLQDVVARAAERRGLASIRLPSGAGHDAQMMARLCPMGMIFVPSIDGISHSPREKTAWHDCANGATMLLDTVLSLDQH
jgi:beta-ureidopropionase / N-carbamoyl-L-amino-acid hydrolase